MTPRRAAAELLRRHDAQRSLIAFTQYTFPRYRAASHHRLIAAQLERLLTGGVDRLMLLVPPRHGKSELASRRFPAFYLGHHPDRHFLSISATADLAADFGRDVRNLISGAEYGSLFETGLAADSHAKGKWHTSAGGVYYSVGIGGAVLGRGAHVMLIDDPFASMDEALSEATRKKVWDWYTGTAYNRLMPGGAIVVISHRMHEDDLAGRLLAQQAAGGDRWEVVELPAIDDYGMALWPEAYSIAALERIRAQHATTVLVGAISATADAGYRRLFQGRLAQALRQSAGARDADGLRRLRLCRDRRRRRLYGACHCRHGPGEPPLCARSLARADIVGEVDRGVLRSGAALETARLGGGARPDQGERRAVSVAPAA